jgi:SAM-dependent methyltransferase
MVAAIDAYQARVTAELRAYNEVEAVHELPEIHFFWISRFVLPLFEAVGVGGVDELWERHVVEQCERRAPNRARLVSLGAGNGEGELPMAARLAERGVTNLELLLLELNPVMIERALELARELGLADRVRAEQADLNTWVARDTADVYIATHSLHHLVELEHLYDEVARSIDPEGVLLVNDMVGRNGHVRWPEAGQIVRRIWASTPARYRHNHFSAEIDDEYPDTDCSTESFEGIRSQDVLPLLLGRFHPDVFVAFGNVIDPFVDRVYGRNFNPADPDDTRLIEKIATLDEAAIELGVLTPTHLVASFRARQVSCRYPGQRSPGRCVRLPDEVLGGEESAELSTLTAQLAQANKRYQDLRSRRAVRLGLALADERRRIERRWHELRSRR